MTQAQAAREPQKWVMVSVPCPFCGEPRTKTIRTEGTTHRVCKLCGGFYAVTRCGPVLTVKGTAK